MKLLNPYKSRLLVVLVSIAAGTLNAQVTGDDALRDVLAPTGTLRAAFLGRNPVQVRIDPNTGEITGPAADVARQLALRLGVSLAIQPLSGVPAVIEAVENGTADIGFLAYDTTRAERVEYTQAYIYGHNSYIVRADSPFQTFSDVDLDGMRIGAISGNAVDLHLSRTLENAELVHLERATPDEESMRRVLSGELDAYAANKERLAAVAVQGSGVRILDGSVLPVEQSIVVARQNQAIIPRLDAFIDEVRNSGLLQEIVDRYAIAGVEVAPTARR